MFSLHFVKTSPITRKTIRVVPDGKQSVSLFIREGKFHGDCEIEDISLDAVKIKMNALPAGLVKYITKRQMALIREIKGMQNG